MHAHVDLWLRRGCSRHAGMWLGKTFLVFSFPPEYVRGRTGWVLLLAVTTSAPGDGGWSYDDTSEISMLGRMFGSCYLSSFDNSFII